MNYQDWMTSVPPTITKDDVWKITAYRFALFVGELAWLDCEKLNTHRLGRNNTSQLIRAAGSISANIEEGFSRNSDKDKARFYEYALGSARETRGWYYKSRHAFGEEVANHRMKLLEEVIRLLLTMIPQKRNAYKVRDPGVEYAISQPEDEFAGLEDTLNNVPMPE
ncbi:MAG: four helix bundle protein [Planctomycetota bacterium]|nr:four helix bundle protein [Planctomycetota bacterium]MDP7251050.1 four helix bundle protein [Planctomycetota bacterium]